MSMPLLKQLKNKVTKLESNKVIKDFGTISFQAETNQKVKIKIPITNTTNINKLIVHILSNYNQVDCAGVLEKTISFITTTTSIVNKSEEYSLIGNKAAAGFSIGKIFLIDGNIEIPIAFLNSKFTKAKIMIEGYYFDNIAKTALENATLSEIYTTDTTVFEKASIIHTNITTGTEYETCRIIDGKKEYAKRIDIGAMPNATTKNIATGLSNITLTRPIEGVMKAANQVLNLPLVNYGISSNTAVNVYLANVSGDTLGIRTNYDWSAATGVVTLHYTKN